LVLRRQLAGHEKKMRFSETIFERRRFSLKNREVPRGNGPVQMITPTTAANR
jgi:hypothetical protein